VKTKLLKTCFRIIDYNKVDKTVISQSMLIIYKNTKKILTLLKNSL